MLISGPEVRRKRNWSEIRIFMPAAGSLRSRTPSSTASENYWYVLRKKPITILLLFILLLPLLFGERSFLSIASYLRIGSKYSWVKIAVMLGVTERTAKRRGEKALDRLGEALEEVSMPDEILGRASRARV